MPSKNSARERSRAILIVKMKLNLADILHFNKQQKLLQSLGPI